MLCKYVIINLPSGVTGVNKAMKHSKGSKMFSGPKGGGSNEGLKNYAHGPASKPASSKIKGDASQSKRHQTPNGIKR